MNQRSGLFYERATPVSLERHRDWSVASGSDFAFARHANAVPIGAVEFAPAAREYPIVFTSGDDAHPLALLGLEERQNLYVTASGAWDAAYVPAFVRRFPFIFATDDGGATFTVCIDESYAGCNQDGVGEQLFADDGSRSPYLERTVRFLRDFEVQNRRSRELCSALKALDLLEPVQANITLRTGRNLSLTGFEMLSRERLKALSGDALETMMRSEQLELAFLHLQSVGNFGNMVDRLAATQADDAPDGQGMATGGDSGAVEASG